MAEKKANHRDVPGQRDIPDEMTVNSPWVPYTRIDLTSKYAVSKFDGLPSTQSW